MSKPRPVFEEDTNFYTRRCHQREYRLTPTDVVRNLFGYLFAVLSQDYRIDLSTVVVEPNHHHTIGRDNEALSPDFTRDLHSFSTRALNRYFKERDSMWNCSQTSQVRLEQGSDILDKMVYAMINPVKDGLVERGDEYSGLRASWPEAPMTFTRPPFWFNPKAKRRDGSQRWPDKAKLILHRPAGFEHLSDDKLIAELAKRMLGAEEAARQKNHDEGRGYIGTAELKKRSRHDRPVTEKPRSKISPRVASKDKHKRIARLLFNRKWRIEHEEARVAFVRGDRDVVFPHGTYKMRVTYGARVAPAPP